MSDDYNAVTELPEVAPGDRFRTENPRVGGVLSAYRRIRTDGDYLRAWDGGSDAIPQMRYTAHVDNNLGRDNHFQGFQRLRRGQYLAISGGDPYDGHGDGPASHVFILKLGSRPAKGPWGSNVVGDHRPPDRDRLVRVVGLDRDLWHGGGMTACGDILAVPVESSKGPAGERSAVVFLNVAQPERPSRFPFRVNRKKAKAGAVALTRLDNGHYLLAVWSDSDAKDRRLDFYLSNSPKFEAGFAPTFVTWFAKDVEAAPGQDRNFSNFQTINFVRQVNGDLFLMGLHNTSIAAPTKPGRDYADLYRVKLPASLDGPHPRLAHPVITKIAKRQFFCHDQQANMDGAAGAYVDTEGRLHVYAAWHWRSDNQFRFNEYRHDPPADAAPITSLQDAWVDLYEHTRFAGRRLSLLGKRGSSIRHFGEISVQGGSFDDKVSSVRFQIPAGVNFVLYEDRNYRGDALELHGTGKVVSIANLHRECDFGDTVSSARYE